MQISSEIWFNDATYQNLRPEYSIDATSAWYQTLIRDSTLFLNNACRKMNFVIVTKYINLERKKCWSEWFVWTI